MQIDRIVRQANSAAAKYRVAREAKVRLSGPGDWEETLRPLLDSDIRSYADPDDDAKKKKGAGKGKRKRGVQDVEEEGEDRDEDEDEEDNLDDLPEDNRRPAGESRRVISWIWRTGGRSTFADGDMAGDESKFRIFLLLYGD